MILFFKRLRIIELSSGFNNLRFVSVYLDFVIVSPYSR